MLGLVKFQQIASTRPGCATSFYSELTKTSTALARLAVLFVLSAARRLVLVFVNSLYFLGVWQHKIAGMQKPPGNLPRGLKLVAGAGFEPTTFGL